MPVTPSFLEQLIFFRLNKAPGPLIDLVAAGVFRAAATASRLGIFDTLNGRPRTAADLAAQLKMNERGLTVLLEFLVASSYVKKEGSQYACTSMSKKWLTIESPTSVAPFFHMFQDFALPFWDNHLEEAIVHGKPSMTLYQLLDTQPGGWRTAQEFFVAAARLAGDEVVNRVKLPPTANRLLDVGGGHGLYSVYFCRRNPALKATIFDQAQPLEAAKKTIADEKIGDRVSTRQGDYWRDDLGTGYDVVLLFNIIHAHEPNENIELFKKVAGILNTDGQVAILEQLADKSSTNAVGATVGFLGLTYLAALGGQTYEYGEVAKWLSTAGFSLPRRIKLRTAAGSSLVITRKQS